MSTVVMSKAGFNNKNKLESHWGQGGREALKEPLSLSSPPFPLPCSGKKDSTK